MLNNESIDSNGESQIYFKIYINLCTPKLFDRLNLESKGKNNGRIKSWGTPLRS
jgi:hypothetical protein